jgi:hypothetical protein
VLAAGPDRTALRAAAQSLIDQFQALHAEDQQTALRADRFHG